jgi:hypothetical protein
MDSCKQKNALDQIEDLAIDILGNCEAALIISETAGRDMGEFAEAGASAAAAEGKIKECIRSLDFLLFSIRESSEKLIDQYGIAAFGAPEDSATDSRAAKA